MIFEPTNPEDLLLRIASGDREAAAIFLSRFGDRLRARVRAQLSDRLRRLFDSQDILATVARRFDRMVADRSITAESMQQVVALLSTMIRNSIVDKARVVQRLERAEGEDVHLRPLAARLRDLPESDEEPLLERVFAVTTDKVDRTILSLWLHDCRLRDIASTIGLSNEACRWRWHRLRGQLRVALESTH